MGDSEKTMKNVYFFSDLQLLPKILNSLGISSFSNHDVLVKLHMGEKKNKYFSKPDYVKQHIAVLLNHNARPFLYDTTVLYNGARRTKEGYKELALNHGFTKENVGCDVVIDDQGIPIEIEGNIYDVGKTLHQSTHILALSHVKGHIATGMGGAIKNFGMGGVTRETKEWLHHGCKPDYNIEKCTFCGICSEICPFNAIDVKNKNWAVNRSCFGCGVCVDNCTFDALDYQRYDLQYTLACSAKACIGHKQVIYVNELKRISKSCDCDPYSGPIICPDIGYLASDDIVAVDTASLDFINKVKPDLFKTIHHIDPEKQLKYGEEIGLGSTDYQLISV